MSKLRKFQPVPQPKKKRSKAEILLLAGGFGVMAFGMAQPAMVTFASLQNSNTANTAIASANTDRTPVGTIGVRAAGAKSSTPKVKSVWDDEPVRVKDMDKKR